MSERGHPKGEDLTGSRVEESIDRILDAALEQFCVLGIRRSSMEDVARRAGIGRATLYRRFDHKDHLVAALMNREIRTMVLAVETAMAAFEDPEDRMVEAFVTGIRLTRRHPLLGALLETESEVILPAITRKAGFQLALVRSAMADQIRRARLQAGDVGPVADEEHVAEFVARVAQSLVLTPETSLPLDDDERARTFARLAIVPLVFARGSSRRTDGRPSR